MLNTAYQGKGYAFEAAHAFFDYLFYQKGARRIYAFTEDYNLPSQKLCKKLGMRQEGLSILLNPRIWQALLNLMTLLLFPTSRVLFPLCWPYLTPLLSAHSDLSAIVFLVAVEPGMW